jgi:hypothetical protein
VEKSHYQGIPNLEQRVNSLCPETGNVPFAKMNFGDYAVNQDLGLGRIGKQDEVRRECGLKLPHHEQGQ